MPDEILVTSEYHPLGQSQKKELIFVTTSLHIPTEQLTDLGIQASAGKEKISMYRRH